MQQVIQSSWQNIYRRAFFVRQFEMALARAFDAGHVPGLLHLCCGAEVAEALLCTNLDPMRDQVTGSHRSHGLALLMGADPQKLALDILGRVGGYGNGMGGTQHIMVPEVGFLTSNGIVGAQVPIALGAALSAKLRQNGGIGVAVFGDGAAHQGATLEAMNLAVSLALPVLFFLENNGFAQTTSSTYASPAQALSGRAAAFGLKAITLDPLAEDAPQTIASAVADVRKNIPTFIEVETTRLTGHYYSDAGQGTANANPLDPLLVLRRRLKEKDISELGEEALSQKAKEAVEAAITAKEASEAEMMEAARGYSCLKA